MGHRRSHLSFCRPSAHRPPPSSAADVSARRVEACLLIRRLHMLGGMQTTRYEAPGTIAGALSVIAAHPGAMVLAGGTDLLVQYQGGLRSPSAFVDVKRIPELMQITTDDSGITIGAAAPAAEICANARIMEWFPGLVD